MVCLICGHKLAVSNSRSQRKANQVWRRRACTHCKAIFTSVEAIDLSRSLLLQKSKTHTEPFSRDKLFVSVYESCKHRKDAIEAAMGLTDTIINRLVPTATESVITRGDVCTVAKHVLRRFDLAAATHYTAYHPI